MPAAAPSPDLTLVREYKRRAELALPGRVAKVVLFGPRARGEGRADSDWNVAVFLRDEPSAADHQGLSALGFDLVVETGAFILPTPLAIRREREDSALMRAIRTEGIAL